MYFRSFHGAPSSRTPLWFWGRGLHCKLDGQNQTSSAGLSQAKRGSVRRWCFLLRDRIVSMIRVGQEASNKREQSSLKQISGAWRLSCSVFGWGERVGFLEEEIETLQTRVVFVQPSSKLVETICKPNAFFKRLVMWIMGSTAPHQQ